MEIERKFTVRTLPEQLGQYPFHHIEQAYLNTDPVVRIRKQDGEYYLTCKGKGLLAREEYNLPLNEHSYYHLREKADGNIITKKRYLIPVGHPTFTSDYQLPVDQISLTVELDIFEAPFENLIIAEVEFPDEQMARAFCPLDWFLDDVTDDPAYHNSNLSRTAINV
ncbi:MAG: CYTH domain-containing protein [Blautia sp.]|nr:CYTH domain-containing protein [Blautia sp.]MCM1200745.1 CYTH domain-containing protein [Bacteroides fragilis]